MRARAASAAVGSTARSWALLCMTANKGRLTRRSGAPAPTGIYHQACDLRVVSGCAGLVKHLALGVPAAPMDARILALFSSSCERGDAGSCVDLGLSYELGRRAVKDEARAV